jgi:hypothetical protein
MRISTLVAILLLAPGAATAQDDTHSPGGAFAVSLLATVAPVAAGVFVDGEEAQVALISAGLVFGPVTGYLSGGAAERGWKGLRFRGIVLGVSAAAIGGICAIGDCQLFGEDETAVGSVIVVGLLGAATIAVSSIVDIVEVPEHVRRANDARRDGGVTLSLAPVVLPANGGAIGLSGRVKF